MHPLLEPYNLFYSNCVAILRGFRDIPQYQACRDGRPFLILSTFKFFKTHLLLKPYNLFYSNGVAILSGFLDIPQNISVGFNDVIN